MNGLLSRMQKLYLEIGSALNSWARRSSALALLLDAVQAYSRDEMGMLAAALAYYLLLSLFPLLLLLIAIATPFLTSEDVVRQTVRFATNYFPSAGGELRKVLEQVVNARGPVTLLAALGLLWSASGVFDLVQRGLNRAWHVTQPRPLWRQRLVSLAAVLGAGFLFGLSFATSAFARSDLRLRYQIGGASFEIVGLVLAIALNFVLFSIIYKVFPYRHVNFRHVWVGALIAAILWEFAKVFFVVYLLNFARFNLVYGSVGAVIALLVWGYITATILLLGAELGAIHAPMNLERR